MASEKAYEETQEKAYEKITNCLLANANQLFACCITNNNCHTNLLQK
jgi:hypothetical protein